MNNEILDLKNDLVFQEVFGKQKNNKITEHFLSLILNRKITNVNLDLNKRMIGNRIDSKTGRLDIRAEFNDGENCNIELQVAPYEYIDKRMLEYWAMMHTSQIDKGQNYEIIKPSIAILITNFKLKQLLNINKYHTKWNLREETYTDIILTKNMEMHILEIPKIKEMQIAVDELALWLKFIQNPSNKEVEKIMEKNENKYLKQAMEELAYLSSDPDFKRLVEAREGFLKDQEAFLEKGKKEQAQEIAKKLLKTKLSIEEIIEITGLSKEELRKLK